jgi:predicted nucleic acid-binding Zn ribbon protein
MPERRSNRTILVPIGPVIDQVMRQYRPASDQGLLKVWEVWAQAVGAVIATHAKPAAFKGDLLLVHVSSSTWLHHLRFLEQEIILKLNTLLGGAKVSHIKLQIGTL